MSKRIKLGFLSGSESWGGLEMNLLRMMKYIKEAGWSCTLFALEDSPIHFAAVDQDFPMVFIQKHRKYYDIRRANQLCKLIDDHQIDVLLFRDNRDMSLVSMAKGFSGNKFKCIYFQGMQLSGNKKDLFHTLRYAKIDAWVAPLHYLANQIKTHTRLSEEKLHILPLPLDIGKFDLSQDTAQAKKEYGFSEEDFVVGTLGRIDPQKLQHKLIEAFQLIQSEFPSLKILIQGDPTIGEGNQYHEKLIELASQTPDRILIRPFSADVSAFYNAIDVFVMSSESETFGTVTIEALAHGKPVIGTNTGGTPEILGQGKFGVLYSPFDSKELSERIIDFGRDKKLLEHFANQAVLHSLKFGKKHFVEGLEKIISGLFEAS